jgi:hypothetical protein
MKVGDHVEWTSQAGGYTKKKRGVIVAVVPAHADVRKHLPEGKTVDSGSLFRPQESYLVEVDGSNYLYWPRAKYLRQPDALTPKEVCEEIAKWNVEALTSDAALMFHHMALKALGR